LALSLAPRGAPRTGLSRRLARERLISCLATTTTTSWRRFAPLIALFAPASPASWPRLTALSHRGLSLPAGEHCRRRRRRSHRHRRRRRRRRPLCRPCCRCRRRRPLCPPRRRRVAAAAAAAVAAAVWRGACVGADRRERRGEPSAAEPSRRARAERPGPAEVRLVTWHTARPSPSVSRTSVARLATAASGVGWRARCGCAASTRPESSCPRGLYVVRTARDRSVKLY
jgi:hypothetical protein